MLRMVKYGRDNALTLRSSESRHLVGYYASVRTFPNYRPMDGNGLAADVWHARAGTVALNKILPPSAFTEFEDGWSSVRAAFPDAFAAQLCLESRRSGLRIAAVTETAYEYRLRVTQASECAVCLRQSHTRTSRCI
jgi:hypothetical protein